MTKLIEAIVKSVALKNYLTILEDEASEKSVRAEKVYQRREKYVNKILMETGTLDATLNEAKVMVKNILVIVDTSILKNCKWIGEIQLPES